MSAFTVTQPVAGTVNHTIRFTHVITILGMITVHQLGYLLASTRDYIILHYIYLRFVKVIMYTVQLERMAILKFMYGRTPAVARTVVILAIQIL